jgi:hypothetical protein
MKWKRWLFDAGFFLNTTKKTAPVLGGGDWHQEDVGQKTEQSEKLSLGAGDKSP